MVALVGHHHRRVVVDTAVKVGDVFVVHANAAIGHKPPIDSGRLVPWIAYSPPDKVRAATPMGLWGDPPGITAGRSGLSRRMSCGGVQAGLRYLPLTKEVPDHCLPARPTPTG